MKTTRLLLGTRGALIHAFHQLGVEADFMTVTSIRKKIGVDQGFEKGTSKYLRRKTIKARVIEWAKSHGHDVQTDNEADAVALLMAGMTNDLG